MNEKIKVSKLMVLVLFYLTTFLPGCAQDKNTSMTIHELKEAIKNDTSLVILDVRTPEELRGPLGKIEGAVNIPVQELEQRIGEVEQFKDKNIAVVCRTGRRSDVAQKILLKHGIESKNVVGGMQEFREE